MSDLLGSMEPNISPMLPRMPPRKRPAEQRVRDLSPGADVKQTVVKRVRIAEKHAPPAAAAADGPFEDNDEFLPSMHKHNDIVLPSDDIPMSDPMPSSPTVRVASRKVQPVQPAEVKKASPEDDDEEDDLLMEVAHAGAVNIASVNMASARPVKKILKAPEPCPPPVHSSPTRTPAPAPAPTTTDSVDTSAWTNLNKNLNLVSSPQTAMPMGKMNHTDAVEEDGSLKFFWTDYAEINNTLCLFGKVLDKRTKKHVSCFVKIDNIMRKLYFLPRETRVVNGCVTDESVGMGDVYSEVDSLMTKMGVKEHKTKPCSRKYAFELPNIPKEGRYLKLLYPYTSKCAR